MNDNKDKLYTLLPSIYRQKDADHGYPLKELLDIIEIQVNIIEQDITQLYNNWFIETCEPWVIPYIADLVGSKLPYPKEEDLERNRAFVANTIRYRRRKGTLSVLESLANDITGWRSRAVEFFKLIDVSQNLNHTRSGLFHTLNVRNNDTLRHVNTPFDVSAHSFDIRSIHNGRGLYNISNIGLYLWRVQAYPVEYAPATKKVDTYYFSQLGNETQLYHHPETEIELEHIAEEQNVPHPITRYELYKLLDVHEDDEWQAVSFRIYVDNNRVPISQIIPWNSDNGDYHPTKHKVAVDPEKGVFKLGPLYKRDQVMVSYYHGFTADIGGGLYNRQLEGRRTIRITKKNLKELNKTLEEHIEDVIKSDAEIKETEEVIIEIDDNEIYPSHELDNKPLFTLEMPKKVSLVLRASQNKRPILNYDINITSKNPDSLIDVVIDGIIINGSISLGESSNSDTVTLGFFKMNHCTLVPERGYALTVNPNYKCFINITNSILSKIVAADSEVLIKDSIIDAVTEYENKIETAIICDELTALNSTVFGLVDVEMVGLVSNCIFNNVVNIDKTQLGCIRYSYVPPESKTPRRFNCQPDKNGNEINESLIYPSFTSLTYGHPGYAQLDVDQTSKTIFEGADNGVEMGAFNHLLQAHRLNHVQLALDEYLRFGLEAGIFLWS